MFFPLFLVSQGNRRSLNKTIKKTLDPLIFRPLRYNHYYCITIYLLYSNTRPTWHSEQRWRPSILRYKLLHSWFFCCTPEQSATGSESAGTNKEPFPFETTWKIQWWINMCISLWVHQHLKSIQLRKISSLQWLYATLPSLRTTDTLILIITVIHGAAVKVALCNCERSVSN